LQERVAATGDSNGEVAGIDFPRTLEEANQGKVQVVPCFYVRRRADLVWDDADEMATCDFPYSAVADKLTRSVRAKVYGGSLWKIKPPADDDKNGWFDNGSQFVATAAAQATYDSATPEHSYYAKWIEPKPEKPKDRVFTFDRLSDDYIVRNYHAYDLEKGAVHLYIQIGRISLVAKLYMDKQNKPAYDAIYGQGVPDVGNYFQILASHVKALKEKNPKVQGTAWFVHSLEGTTGPPKFTQQATAIKANL